MRIRLVLVLLALLAVALSSPRPALAGIIDVSGTFSISKGGTVGVTLAGDRSFAVSARFDGVDGFVGPWNSCNPCLAGQQINLLLGAIDSAFGGSATLDGNTYFLGSAFGPTHLSLSLGGGPPVFAPPVNVAPIVALTSPVDFQGGFSVDQIGVEQLRATATATVEIQRIEGGCGSFGDCWHFVGAEYELTPTPEPATLVLFGTTMAGRGLAARWRQRRQN